MEYEVLRRDIVWVDDPDSDFAWAQREATEDDETFDEDDRPLIQLGDMIDACAAKLVARSGGPWAST